MNIKAGVPVYTSNCQPIKNKSFTKSASNDLYDSKNNYDSFSYSDSNTQEQKFDLACRLAAYYRSQYENLQQKTGCYA